MDFLRLARLVIRHNWLLVVLVTVATIATWVGARLKGVAYQASATLMPQEQALQAMGGTASFATHLGSQETQETTLQQRRAQMDSLIALMMSPRVLGQLITKLQ